MTAGQQLISAYIHHVSPVQWIVWFRDDEQSVDGIKDLFHGYMGIVVAIKDVVADSTHTVDVAVINLLSVKKFSLENNSRYINSVMML